MFELLHSVWGPFFILDDTSSYAQSGVYIFSLVLLSYVIASLGSFTGLRLATEIHNAPTQKLKSLLHFGGAFAFGTGIWSMHFIGMLAYKMDMAVSYAPGLTILSMFIAVVIAYGVLQIIRAGSLKWQSLCAGALLLGSAICAMHYTGMAAMKMDAALLYKPGLFFLSVLIAVGASGAALWIVFMLVQHESRWKIVLQIMAALVMGGAICGMHYTGIAASVFIPYADCRYDPNQSFTGLALAVTLTSTAIFAIALILSFKRDFSGEEIQSENAYSGNTVFLQLSLLLSIFLILMTTSYVFLNDAFHKQKNGEILLNAASLQRTLITRYGVRMPIILTSKARNNTQEYEEHMAGILVDIDRINENYNGLLNGGVIDLGLGEERTDKDGIYEVNGLQNSMLEDKVHRAQQQWVTFENMGSEILNSGISDLMDYKNYEGFERQYFRLVNAQDMATKSIQEYLESLNDVLSLKQKIIQVLGVFVFFLTLVYARFFIADRIDYARRQLEENKNTLEKRVEEQTRDIINQKTRTETIINSMNEGLITMDGFGYITSYNDSCVSIFGYQPEEVIGKHASIFLHERHYAEYEMFINQYHGSGRKDMFVVKNEVLGQRKDGSNFPASLSFRHIYFENKPMFICTVEDITQRKERERELKEARDNAERLNKQMQDYTDKLELARSNAEDACHR